MARDGVEPTMRMAYECLHCNTVWTRASHLVEAGTCDCGREIRPHLVEELEDVMGISASEAFDLVEIGRCEYGGTQWVVFTDGAYRHVVDAHHFDSCGYLTRKPDEEHRADDYSEWCRNGLWANDRVAAKVAALCDLTFVHSAESGVCGRVDAKEDSDG